MTACKPAPAETRTGRPTLETNRHEPFPEPPDRRLWKSDSARAFEVAAQWFLAVSREA